MKRTFVLAALAAASLGVLAGPVAAMSDGAYDFEKQGCTGAADNHDMDTSTEPSCHNIQLTGEDAGGHRYADVSTNQTPDGTNVHDGTISADPGGQSCAGTFDLGVTNAAAPGAPAGGCTDSAQPGPDPSNGGGVYFGADDNLDSGEHDSSGYSDNGPSDGGGIRAAIDPASLALWLDALSRGDRAYILAHPLPVLIGATGACADGVCLSAQTERRVVFEGDRNHVERNAYDYEGKEWDPYTCGGPTDQSDDCGGHDLDKWNKGEGTVYAQPGVQVYEDPDPQGSPIDPLYDGGATPEPTLYPIPAAYAGTCGVTVGGGPLSLPGGNEQGQVGASTGC